jgi:predicted ATP-grasp superfamily ATP-dependent carboligase
MKSPAASVRPKPTQALARACLLAIVVLAGCSRPDATGDPAPFQAAIEQYLQRNNMALRLREVKQGPIVSGPSATMTVSLTHAELGGPSVVWEFVFSQEANGQWNAVRHQD